MPNSLIYNVESQTREINISFDCSYNDELNILSIIINEKINHTYFTKEVAMTLFNFVQKTGIDKLYLVIALKNPNYILLLQEMMTLGFQSEKSVKSTNIDGESYKILVIETKDMSINIEEFGRKMFKAASSVAGLSVDEIIHYDMKTFNFENSTLAIGQVVTMDFEDIHKRCDEIINGLNKMCEFGNYKTALLFITDIINSGSYMFFNESSKELLSEAYGIDDLKQGVYMDGIVSRKKQMLPPLLEFEERR